MKTENTFFATGLFVAVFGALFALTTSSTLGSETPQFPKPDLVIADAVVNQAVTSEYADITVRVSNRGNKASRNSWVGVYVNEEFRRSCAVAPLQAGQTTAVKCKYYFAAEEKSQPLVPATLFVDDMEEIWESNENNNKVGFSIPTRRGVTDPIIRETSFVQPFNPLDSVLMGPVYTPAPIVTPEPVQSVCEACIAQQRGRYNVQESYTRNSASDLYQYNPNAPIYTVKTKGNSVSCPFGTNRSCFATTTYARNNATGQCKSFPTTCLPPQGGWTRVARCEDTPVVVAPEKPFIERTDEHFAVYNGELALGQLIDLNVGDTVDSEVALMEIDNTKRNFVYQNISNNFSLNTISFPEDAVRCWTNQRSTGTTVYCRGEEANSSIQYQLTARKKGVAPILTKVQYDLNGEIIKRKGTQLFNVR